MTWDDDSMFDDRRWWCGGDMDLSGRSDRTFEECDMAEIGFSGCLDEPLRAFDDVGKVGAMWLGGLRRSDTVLRNLKT